MKQSILFVSLQAQAQAQAQACLKARPLQFSLKAVKFLLRPPARVCFAVLNLAISFDRADFHTPS